MFIELLSPETISSTRCSLPAQNYKKLLHGASTRFYLVIWLSTCILKSSIAMFRLTLSSEFKYSKYLRIVNPFSQALSSYAINRKYQLMTKNTSEFKYSKYFRILNPFSKALSSYAINRKYQLMTKNTHLSLLQNAISSKYYLILQEASVTPVNLKYKQFVLL